MKLVECCSCWANCTGLVRCVRMFGVIDWNVSVMRHPVELEFNTDSVGEVREECMGLELAHPGSLNRLEMLQSAGII